MMVCSEHDLKRLEFPRLRRLLAGQTQTEAGGQLAERLTPLPDRQQVELALSEVEEAGCLLREGRTPGLGGCSDLRPLLERVQAAGSLLPAEELLKVAAVIQVADQCRERLAGQTNTPLLAEQAAGLVGCSELQRRLTESIGSRGELLDTASFELGDIRYQLRQTRNRIRQQLEKLLSDEQYGGVFQERLVTIRNGRYVVPIKADFRGQLKGFVQDESASGQTLYLEPETTLGGNNRLQQLLREEQREEQRVLLQLADLVRRDRPLLLENQRRLARIDLRLASARLARQYGGCRPQLVAEPLIALRQARHPLLMESVSGLESQRAVPIDLLLGREVQALVISGPNTGGKSVALKTLGLLLLMVGSGLPIPCHPDSRLHLFRQLHVDIGDEQSIAEKLSTFSGHLRRLCEILERADADTLVLLDEAGTGTDPAEGAALVQAVLVRLGELGAKTVLTTHLGQLKQFAHQRAGLENAAVEFDPETLEPNYRLQYGIPGASSAMATARRLGLPAAVLRQAEEFLGEGELASTELLVQLAEQRLQLERELAAAAQAGCEARQERQRRREQVRQLKERKAEILARASRQAELLIAETETRLKNLRKRRPAVEPAEAVADREQLNAARERLRSFTPSRQRRGAIPDQLEVGELVRVIALGVEGRVERLYDGGVELLIAGKRLRQPLTGLEQFTPRRFAGTVPAPRAMTRNLGSRGFEPRLKLVGQRVDEAMPLLERWIDDGLLHGLTQLEVVHGAGEGILRRAVRELLAGHAGVTAFYAASAEQGGDRVTIVELSER